MRFFILIIITLSAFSFSTITANAHGGGCRKASPPGQCCHADNSRGGKVHCH